MPDEYIFLDKSAVPTDEQLKESLGKTFNYWEEVQKYIAENIGETIPEWKFYTKKTGWARKTMLKKKNLFFFYPFKKYFNLVFIFGDKAVAEIEKSAISQELIDKLLATKKFAEGRGLAVKVDKKSKLKDVFNLIEIKVRG